ncbi:MAG: hypothetical protein SFW09_03575 [Hyphomicrobiaceae bacterium]|nr:hypothetical protein [Hyphomicrobiaceae bacterium]
MQDEPSSRPSWFPSGPRGQAPDPASPSVEGRHIVEALSIVLAPLVVGFIAAFALSVPEQTREIYRVFARDYAYGGPQPTDADWPAVLQWAWQRLGLAPIDLGWIGATAAGVLNWLLARNLTLLFARPHLAERNVRGFALRWLPRLCGALIPLGAGTGLLLAAGEVHKLPFDVLAAPSVPRQDDAATNLRFMGYFFYFLAFVLVTSAFLRTRGSRQTKYVEANRWLFSTPAVVVIVALTLSLVCLFSATWSGGLGVGVAWTLGTPALFCLFAMIIAYFTTGLAIVTRVRGIPIIPIIAIYVALLALGDLNDNHTVTVSRSPAAFSRPTTREAFRAWYESRADRELYQRTARPYPVFLVTAAGGGLYAADFAATGLARLQDGCPAFAQHTFAISGVSGGSFGGALFAALLSGTPQVRAADAVDGDPCLAGPTTAGPSVESEVSALVHQDYLAPVVAAGLFTDFPQRFLPWPIGALDRSRAFEATLDRVWHRTHPACREKSCMPFSRLFLDTWTPGDRAPALVLNTTNVDVGYRTTIAPFVIARDIPGEYSALQNFHEALSGRGTGPDGGDITLAAAIGLSSRFPWLMPAATIRLPDGKPKLRLLDGGIFENSGVDTLADMLIDLAGLEIEPSQRKSEEAKREPWVVFHPIVISGYQLNSDSRDTGLRGEVLSPVSAMLSARVQRAGMSSYRLFRERGYHCGKAGQSENCTRGGLRFLVLNHEDFRLPLGWQLSTFTRDVVRHHVGSAEDCDPIPKIRDMFGAPSSYQRQQYTVRENTCTACAVRVALRGATLDSSNFCKTKR